MSETIQILLQIRDNVLIVTSSTSLSAKPPFTFHIRALSHITFCAQNVPSRRVQWTSSHYKEPTVACHKVTSQRRYFEPFPCALRPLRALFLCLAECHFSFTNQRLFSFSSLHNAGVLCQIKQFILLVVVASTPWPVTLVFGFISRLEPVAH